MRPVRFIHCDEDKMRLACHRDIGAIERPEGCDITVTGALEVHPR